MDRVNRNDKQVRIAFWTLGCRLNQYDTESMKTHLATGMPVTFVPWDSEADVYVLNSCTVTGKADQECRRLARQVKRHRPDSKVVVVGCYAQTQPEDLQDIPEIDGIVGNTAKENITEWLPEVVAGNSRLVRVADFGRRQDFAAPIINEFTGRSRAFVKVQDGCDLRCAYCLIWQARGPARSRPLADILSQLQALVDAGYHEVVLAGVHLGGYGRDLTPRSDLPELLLGIMTAYPDLRLRLSSIHPNEVGSSLLSLWPDHPQLRPHLHISLQSGSDTVLARMHRPYRSQAARDCLEYVASTIPYCGIGADIIVGFPGETSAEFAATQDLIQSLPFTYLHVFRYSPRPGTPAAALEGRVHPETVSERSALLRELAQAKNRHFTEKLAGQQREVVVEAAAAETGWHHGTTDNYASIRIPGSWTEGTLVSCRLSSQADGVLVAHSPRMENPARTDPGDSGGSPP